MSDISQQRMMDWLLRGALAFAFLYPPVAAYLDPNSWIGYFPSFMRGVVPDEMLLLGFGVIEIALALWLISGWRVQIPAAAMAALLLLIVVFNPGQFPVLFRDVSLALVALAIVINNQLHSRLTT